MAIMVNEPNALDVKRALHTAITEEETKQILLNRFEEKRSYFSWHRAAREFCAFLEGCRI
jgi:uncharacterized cupin superfamily protein